MPTTLYEFPLLGRLPASSMPGVKWITDTNFNWLALAFAAGSNEHLFYFGAVPQIYSASANIQIVGKWITDTSSTGTVQWQAKYLGRKLGETWDVALSSAALSNSTRTAGDAVHDFTVSFASPALEPGDRFILDFQRNGSVAADTYPVDAWMTEIRLEAA